MSSLAARPPGMTPEPGDATSRDRGPGTEAAVLQVDDLSVRFRTPHGLLHAVNGLSWSLGRGESLAILGESGSGKSVSAQAIMGILESPPAEITSGRLLFHGDDLLTMDAEPRRKLRGDAISIVFQDALSALNPVFTVGSQIAEMFRTHRGMSRRDSKKAAVELMDRVQIPGAASRAGDYPHQFSGGMRQRVMIAMGIALEPEVLIADEPTTALDVTVQAQVMRLLADLQAETGMSLVLITHDLGVVAEVVDRVVVMYAGRAVETGDLGDVFARPSHPYTRGLMRSIPRLDAKGGRLDPIEGAPPDLRRIPSGCAFHPRCSWVQDVCSSEEPDLLAVADQRSRCHFREDVARAESPL